MVQGCVEATATKFVDTVVLRHEAPAPVDDVAQAGVDKFEPPTVTS